MGKGKWTIGAFSSPARCMFRWRKLRFLGLAVAIVSLLAFPAAAQIDPYRCSLNGVDLYGKVQVVQSLADLKVQVVTFAPDLKVKFVENFPDECGKWQIVDIFPDLKIQIVDIFPDLKIQLVGSSPGIP